MKILILLIFLSSFLGCETQPQKRTEVFNSEHAKEEVSERRKVESSKEEYNTQVAIEFLNSYGESLMSAESSYSILTWAKATPYATKEFKTKLDKMITQGFRDDPVVGLGFDPIFDGQDSPVDGFDIVEFDGKTGYLTMKGSDEWDMYRVTMRLVNQNGKTLVDGCGVVNIPEDKVYRE